MNIIGAGLAGLLAANYFRRHNPNVWEAQSSLPNNHDALLRFRTNVVGRVAGIPFREVSVSKELYSNKQYLDRCNVYTGNSYSLKTSGVVMDRSVWDLSPGKRYIAPKNLISHMSQNVNIRYDSMLDAKAIKALAEASPVITTAPMPILMKMFRWKHQPNFKYQSIWAITMDITKPYMDVYQTIYFSDLGDMRYRASITGDRLIIEMLLDPEKDAAKIANETLELFGIPSQLAEVSNFTCKRQQYGKIVPIDNNIRQEFIYWLTREHNVYSLGRFATWRQILLDDLVKDLQLIEKLSSLEGKRSLYSQALAETKAEKSPILN